MTKSRLAPMVSFFAAVTLAMTGCSGSRDRSRAVGKAPSGASSTSTGAALTGTFTSVCGYFVSTRVLNRARQLAQQGVSADPTATAAVHRQLAQVLAVSPRIMRLALTNINNQVGTDITPQVIPDTNLLQGECRARGLPYPVY